MNHSFIRRLIRDYLVSTTLAEPVSDADARSSTGTVWSANGLHRGWMIVGLLVIRDQHA